MTESRDLPEVDPELILKAAQASRLLLENTLRAAGMPADRAADAADATVLDLDSLVVDDLLIDPGLGAQLEASLRDRLEEILSTAEHGAAIEQMLIAAGSAIGMGDDDKGRRRRILLALVVCASVLPDFTIRSDGTWEVSKQPVVVTVVDRVMRSVDHAITTWRRTEQPPAPEPGTPHSERARESPASPVIVDVSPSEDLGGPGTIARLFNDDPGSAVAQLGGRRVDLGNNNFAVIDREYALALRDQIVIGMNRWSETYDWHNFDRRSWFHEHHKTWDRKPLLTFDAGLLPVAWRGTIAYRVGVRVQSPGMFKPRAWNQLYTALGALLMGVGSVRAMSPAHALAGPAARHGSAISVRDGLRGTITCAALERDTNQHLLITAGHIASKQGVLTNVIGRDAYSPPPVDTSDRPIGTVSHVSVITRPWQLYPATLVGQPPEPDIAAILVPDATRIAPEGARRREGTNPLLRETVAVTDQDVSNRVPVLKGSGKTRSMLGQLVMRDLAINLTYPETTRTVCAVGLLEVRLDRPAKPGDSGAPCFDSTGRLLGLVVAGVDRAAQSSDLTQMASHVYVQPVHEIFMQRGWEVF